jgi:hypothetical protein
MPADQRHLSAAEVAHILHIVQDSDTVLVGGQCLNFWAEHYANRDSTLAALRPFTSKDIDFFGNMEAAQKLATSFQGTLLIPDLDDHSPHTALVVGVLNERRIDIDFLRAVLGVNKSAVTKRCVTLVGRDPVSGNVLRVMLLNPLDCLQSRYANINILGRRDDLSLKQAESAVHVLKLYVADLLDGGERKEAQRMLRDLEFVARDGFLRKPASRYEKLDPLPVLQSFLNHPLLDPRWRTHNLANSVGRVEEIRERFAAKNSAEILESNAI